MTADSPYGPDRENFQMLEAAIGKAERYRNEAHIQTEERDEAVAERDQLRAQLALLIHPVVKDLADAEEAIDHQLEVNGPSDLASSLP